MTEQTQVQQVTLKDHRKVEAGKRLAEYNRREREEIVRLTYGKGLIINMQKLVLGAYLSDFTSQKNKNWQNYTAFGA